MNDGPVLSTARELTDALAGLREELRRSREASEARDRELTRQAKRDRRLLIASITGWALDIILTIVLIVVGFQAYSAGSEARTAQQQGTVVVENICARLGKIAALHAPAPADPAAHQSQQLLHSLVGDLAGLGSDLGCGKLPQP